MEPQPNTTSPRPNFPFVWLAVGCASFLVTGLTAGFYFGKNSIPTTPTPIGVGCTEEAKICPDGSTVGRTGPNCEFTPCPPVQVTTPVAVSTTPAPTTIPKKQYSVPGSWLKYDKSFQNLQYTFYYPPDLKISDQDEASGDIELLNEKYEDYLLIGRLSSLGFQEYDGGSRREWFIRAFKKQFPGESSDGLSFKELLLGSNSFYVVTNSNTNNSLIQPNSDFIFGIFGGKAVRIRDFRKLPKDDIYAFLTNLTIK